MGSGGGASASCCVSVSTAAVGEGSAMACCQGLKGGGCAGKRVCCASVRVRERVYV